METATEPKTTDGRPSACIFDGVKLSGWTERDSDLFLRSSTVCKSCASIYISNLNRATAEIRNYVRRLGQHEGWKCIGCDARLERVTLHKEVIGLLDFIRQSSRTVPVEIMQCPGCGTSSNERMEPVMMLR